MSRFKVAVILAAFNGAEWIEAQIKSIFAQIDCEINIHVRDDGSTDSTIILLNKLKLKCEINIVNSKGCATKSASLNFFKIINEVDFSSYDYIALSDQDDIWFPEKLNEGISYIEKNKADAYSSNLIAYDNQMMKSWFIDKNLKQKKFDYLFQGASAGCTYILSAKALAIVKNSLSKSKYTFSGFESHDWIIYAICRSHGLRWVHDDRSFIAYRQHSRNVFGAKPGLVGLISKFKIVRSGWYRSNVSLLSNFIEKDKFELQVMKSVDDASLQSKIFLLSNVFSFRRDLKGCIYLALLLIFGIF